MPLMLGFGASPDISRWEQAVTDHPTELLEPTLSAAPSDEHPRYERPPSLEEF